MFPDLNGLPPPPNKLLRSAGNLRRGRKEPSSDLLTICWPAVTPANAWLSTGWMSSATLIHKGSPTTMSVAVRGVTGNMLFAILTAMSHLISLLLSAGGVSRRIAGFTVGRQRRAQPDARRNPQSSGASGSCRTAAAAGDGDVCGSMDGESAAGSAAPGFAVCAAIEGIDDSRARSV
jgi:hypothetical protein